MDGYDPDWVTEEAIAALKGSANPMAQELAEDPVKKAAERLRSHAEAAVAELIRISQDAPNDRIRLDANKYILDRIFGPASNPLNPGEISPVQATIEGLISEVERFANVTKSE